MTTTLITLTNIQLEKNSTATKYAMSNYYPPSQNNGYYSVSDYAVLSVDGNRIRFKNKDCTSLEEWKSHLDSLEEPLYVIYALSNSKTENIELPDLSVYDDSYSITIETSVPATIK